MCGAIPPVAYITSWLGQEIIHLIFNAKECLLKLRVRIKFRTKQRVSFLMYFRLRLLYHTESLRLPSYPMTPAVIRTPIKETKYI
jgi:hypothetical protein